MFSELMTSQGPIALKMKMADISTEKVVLCVKNEGTDISDHMGVFQMIQEMDYVCLGSKDSKNSIFLL